MSRRCALLDAGKVDTPGWSVDARLKRSPRAMTLRAKHGQDPTGHGA